MNKKKHIITNNSEETYALGKKFAKNLLGGEIFFLSGHLGGGKTVFVKGLAKGLKIKETITSPTFTLCQQYSITKKIFGKLIHLDLYRLNKRNEILNLGLEEFFNSRNIVCIEWSERLGKFFPGIKAIEVEFIYNKESERTLVFKNIPKYLLIN